MAVVVLAVFAAVALLNPTSTTPRLTEDGMEEDRLKAAGSEACSSHLRPSCLKASEGRFPGFQGFGVPGLGFRV